ncbi:hypothetical protein ACT3CD_11300 [Geofilum sp. OHC36d9]|uniref:hypothetical protein n=1 Tax=Geofilum sp. OHC36d9 TaxID=3458413 RepID=UPI004033E859
MKKLLINLFFILSISTSVFCQIEEKMKDEGVVSGVIYKNGGEIEGYIKMTGMAYTNEEWFPAPWQFQSGIKFIPKDVFEKNEKIKNKFYEKYGAKDCDGYRYDTLVYESVKYADMSAVGMNMLPKKMFMRKVSEDKISLYHYFNTPPAVVSGSEGFEPYYLECANILFVYRIGKDGKLKLVNDLNIEKELSDCPMVLEKQSKGEYKIVGSKEESSGFNKLVNNSVFREEVRLQAIEDYNQNCK